MPEKSPETYTLITYLWVFALAAWGGVVNYIKKVKDGITPRFSFAELVGEIVSSGFFGLMTFWLCQAAGFDQLLTAVFVGISGHMGARTIFIIERMIQKKLGIKVVIHEKEDADGKPNHKNRS